MNSQSLRDEFDIRFLHWKMMEVESEVRKGLPSIRMLDNPKAKRIVEIFETLPVEDQECLAITLAKRSNPHTLKLINESLTDKENRFCEWFFAQLSSYTQFLAEVEFYKNSPENILSAKAIKLLMIERLKPSLGVPCRTDRTGLYYKTFIGCWDVTTWIGIDKNVTTYSHSIWARESKLIKLGASVGISVATWFGFDRNVVKWVFLTENNASKVPQSLANICLYFINILPNLLVDLDI